MSGVPRGLEAKSVYDWDHQPLGTVLGSEFDPRTHGPTSLIIGLSEDAREMLGTNEETIALPFDFVFGIRRDEVRLDRPMRDLLVQVARSPDVVEEATVVEVAPLS